MTNLRLYTNEYFVLGENILQLKYESARPKSYGEKLPKRYQLSLLLLSLEALFLAMCATGAAHAFTASFVAGAYQDSDGAISVNAYGDFVDPYFANRALTLADESGLDIHASVSRWIPWAIARQLPDGRFQRYCKSESAAWSPCQSSDADDASLALWLELLYRLAPNSGLPLNWKSSTDRANRYLEKLHDNGTGLYFVSLETRVSLLMDNVEVYHLFRVLAAANRRFGHPDLGDYYQRKANRLAQAISARLWVPAEHAFLTSTQNSPAQSPATRAFYPDDVAQVYPWLFNMPTPAGNAKAAFQRWLKFYGSTWLNRDGDDFPWGVVALAAFRLGDTTCVRQWITQNASLSLSSSLSLGSGTLKSETLGPDQGRYWTVLDETVLQILRQKSLSPGPPQ
jgi:hypothetical protein